MIITKDFLKQVKPKKVNMSDKYSSRLYKLLRDFIDHNVVVYKYKNDNINFIVIGVIPKNSKNISGVNLNILVRSRGDMDKIFSEFPISKTDGIDYSISWFEDYKTIGRCLFLSHKDVWITSSEERYTELKPNIRVCNWCEKKDIIERM